MDDYITICPSGFEKYVIQAIKESIPCPDYECTIDILTPRPDNSEISELKTKLGSKLEKKRTRKGDNKNLHLMHNEKLFGTVDLGDGKLANIGFDDDDECIISYPGGLEGKIILQVKTNAPPSLVADIRPNGCGVLLATVFVSKLSHESTLDLGASKRKFTDIIDTMKTHKYKQRLFVALKLWSKYAHNWYEMNKKFIKRPQRLSQDDTVAQSPIDSLLNGTCPYKYRLSCLRYGKQWSYKREELLAELADILVPYDTLKDGTTPRYMVNLTKYDFDLVILIQKGITVVAVSLNPYQYVGAKGFDRNTMPPDIIKPYVSKEISETVVRLRPSIASLLYHISGVKKGDIIVDPCAGMNTIPNEGALRGCFALGGDVAMCCDHGLGKIASSYFKDVLKYQLDKKWSGAADVLSWNASLIPVRDGCVDCIISDLPFGVRCMSAAKLKSFLPLLFSECARILCKGGKMTILCGTVNVILEGIKDADYEATLFDTPSAIFPVNIGGLQAWVLQVTRSLDNAQSIQNHRSRAIRLAKIHDRRIKSGAHNVQS